MNRHSHGLSGAARRVCIESASDQRGVGLIEILLAVLLISVGFLAAARMQVEGMRFSRSAYHQSQAYFVAADMIDRMRGNPTGVRDRHYVNAAMEAELADPGCNTKACDPEDLAEQDVFEWSAYVHEPEGAEGFLAILPSSSAASAGGRIEVDADGVYSVIVQWSEAIGNADTLESIRVDFAL